MSDLSTRWLGIPLANPLIVGASRLTADMGVIKRIEAAGAGAIVTASLFEEQIELQNDLLEDFAMDYDSREQPELSIHPGLSYAGPEEHLEWVKRAKRAVSIPLFASLNARTHDVWLDWSERLAETGVDGLELNLYATPCDPFVPGDRIEDEQVSVRAGAMGRHHWGNLIRRVEDDQRGAPFERRRDRHRCRLETAGTSEHDAMRRTERTVEA